MGPKQKFYAVRVGREGPKIYHSWADTDRAVRNFPYAQHKSFLSIEAAQGWLEESIKQPKASIAEYQTPKKTLEQSTPTTDSGPNPKKRKLDSDPARLDSNTNSNEILNSSEIGSSTTTLSKTISRPLIQKTLSPSVDPPVDSNQGCCAALPSLSSDQIRVFQTVIAEQSVFFTGSAGTGKSYLLKTMIDHLRTQLQKVVYVTASTGIAASLIKGTTLHSFAGLGLAKDSIDKLYFKVISSKSSSKRWNSVDVLIIDEVSMIDGDFFDKLNAVAKLIRKSDQPFGGIQLILTGDFFQLPPVTKFGAACSRTPYLFKSDSWSECVPKILVLKHVFRQSDAEFVGILNEIRQGTVSPQTIKIMNSLTRKVEYSDGIQPTELYPRKNDVESANAHRLKCLDSPPVTFQSHDRQNANSDIPIQDFVEQLDKTLLVSSRLVLKTGAQVMLVKNMPDEGLVNGSIGVITGFSELVENYEGIGEPRSNSHNRSSNSAQGGGEKWPIVQFTNGRKLTFTRQSFEIENSSGETIGSRHQVPLILAWALSIHKSQGQTLERVLIDLERSFEKGQVYVALSRVTSLKSVQVKGFHPSKVEAHPVVLAWARKHILN